MQEILIWNFFSVLKCILMYISNCAFNKNLLTNFRGLLKKGMFALQIQQEHICRTYNNENIQLMRGTSFVIFFMAKQHICMTVAKGTREIACRLSKEISQSTPGNSLSFSIFGSKELQVSKYSARNPSIEKRISGGRVNLQENINLSL